MSRRTRSHRAVTLIELLVVIGIVAILAGILVPAVWAGLRYARRTLCIARLHTLHAAMMLYAADYDHHLPLCHFSPSMADQLTWPPYPPKSPPEWYTLHYAMGDYVDDWTTFMCPAHPRPMDWMKDLAQLERGKIPAGRQWWMSYQVNCGLPALDLRQLTWPPQYAGLLRCQGEHFGRWNMLYADGHIARLTNFLLFECIRDNWRYVGSDIVAKYKAGDL